MADAGDTHQQQQNCVVMYTVIFIYNCFTYVCNLFRV